MPQLDNPQVASQLFWLAIHFGLLLFLFMKIAIPAMRGILEMRQQRIAADLELATSLKNDADRHDAKARVNHKAAVENANKHIARANEQAEQALTEHKKRAEQSIAKKLAEAEAKFQAIRAEGVEAAPGIAKDVLEKAIAKVFGEGVTIKADAYIKGAS